MKFPWKPINKNIPTSPGVYKYLDAGGRVIYVGKAKNLRNRISSYFVNTQNQSVKTQYMLNEANAVEWTVVSSEIESLLLEYQWIKGFNPKYNVIFRDDKSYPYLAISIKDDFPRIFITRNKKSKSNLYFGPYPKVWAIRDIYALFQTAFQFRSCTAGVFNKAKRDGRPCLLGFINKCTAPCVGRIDKDEYAAHLGEFIEFLRGKHNPTSQKLKHEMRTAAKEENFEDAAIYRDKLQAIDVLHEKSSVMLGDRESLDVIGLAQDELRAVAHIFFVRFGRLIGERQILLENTDDSDTLCEQILMELYFDSEVDVLRNTLSTDAFTIPKEVLLERSFEQKESVEKLLEGKALRKVKIFTPRRGEKHALLIRAKENAEQGLFAYKLKRKNDFIARTAALNELKEKLMLAKAPYRIECYDNSHIQGTNRVSSMVVFEDGLPKNKDYRHFIVKNIFDDLRRDDTQAMYELLRRRLAYLSEDNTSESDESLTTCPDLIVIDGGKGQLRYAYKAYKDSGVGKKIEFVSLAKRLEEVFLVGRSESVMLPRNSDALFMLQFLRDESHRFAIEFHRLRRQKSMTKSKLDSIQGLGESKKNALLKRFGSVKGIASATKDQLMEVDGIGAKLAETIMNAVAP